MPHTTATSIAPATHIKILAVDDEPIVLEVLCSMLESAGRDIQVTGAGTKEEAIAAMESVRPHVVLLDLALPGVKGFELLDTLGAIDPYAEIVMLTGNSSVESAVEAVLHGASDYVLKPISPERLNAKCDEWRKQARLLVSQSELDRELAHTSKLDGLIGRSPLMLLLQSKIRRIAPYFSNVLILGETGTGKELVARTLHQLGAGVSRPFVVCNCAAIPESLFESELFGHTRGSFTGAHADRKGLIESAAGGTLFLDEVAEVPLASQAKLLRFLQSREIQRIGSSRTQMFQVRVVAATNADLVAMMDQKRFREDLYFRLSSVSIEVPSLTERREDIPLLVKHFLEIYGNEYGKPGLYLSRKAQAFVARYSWPGNVRELENALSYAAMVCQEDCVDVLDFPDSLQRGPANENSLGHGFLTLSEVEQRYVRQVLNHCHGNRTSAAQILGISRATIYRMLKEDPPPGSADASKASPAPTRGEDQP